MVDLHEIDISGRLEQLEKPTVLALGGPKHRFAVLLPAEEKLPLAISIEIEERKRSEATGKKMRNQADRDQRVFSILLFFNLKHCPNTVETVVLDRDYDKKRMRQAKNFALKLLKEEKISSTNLALIVGSAGKGLAHDVALKTYRGERKANLTVSAEDVMPYYLGKKKATSKGG